MLLSFVSDELDGDGFADQDSEVTGPLCEFQCGWIVGYVDGRSHVGVSAEEFLGTFEVS